MLNESEFNNLLCEKIYYFKDEDIVPPQTSKKLKATLLSINGKEFWIPNKVVRQLKLINTHTGELLRGWLVKKSFLRSDKRRNYLRTADLDYDSSGSDVQLSGGWHWYTPEIQI